MSKEMSCYVLYGEKDIRCERREIPSLKPKEVLIRMKRVGICGSDIHYFYDGGVGNFTVNHPFIIGHEGAGEVAGIGEGVTNLTVGMRVAISPSQPCYQCKYCTDGRYNLCTNMRYLGSASTNPHVNGVFCEYFITTSRNCYPIPDSLGYAEAAMIEPLSVAMNVVKRAGIKHSSSVLIIGVGTIGQLILLVARAFGANKIAVSEIIKERRELAVAQGADISLNPFDPLTNKQLMDFSGGGFDVVIEASGTPSAIRQTIELTQPGGTIVLVGLSPEEVSLPISNITTKELQIVGSYRFANVFDDAINLAASGRIDLKPLITNTLSYEKLKDAIQLAGLKGPVIKVQVEI
jgi:L-idonate 5-dehydrogenase